MAKIEPGDFVRSGIDPELEHKADWILWADRKDIINPSEKNDILLEDTLRKRYAKEVYNSRGVPDGRYMSGLYRRAYNPLMGKRPTKANRFALWRDPWHQDFYEEMAASDGWMPGYNWSWNSRNVPIRSTPRPT